MAGENKFYYICEFASQCEADCLHRQPHYWVEDEDDRGVACIKTSCPESITGKAHCRIMRINEEKEKKETKGFCPICGGTKIKRQASDRYICSTCSVLFSDPIKFLIQDNQDEKEPIKTRVIRINKKSSIPQKTLLKKNRIRLYLCTRPTDVPCPYGIYIYKDHTNDDILDDSRLYFCINVGILISNIICKHKKPIMVEI